MLIRQGWESPEDGLGRGEECEAVNCSIKVYINEIKSKTVPKTVANFLFTPGNLVPPQRMTDPGRGGGFPEAEWDRAYKLSWASATSNPAPMPCKGPLV